MRWSRERQGPFLWVICLRGYGGGTVVSIPLGFRCQRWWSKERYVSFLWALGVRGYRVGNVRFNSLGLSVPGEVECVEV